MSQNVVRVQYGAIARRLMADTGGVVREAQRAAIDAGGAFLMTALAVKTPVGATGKARQSVRYEPPGAASPHRGTVGYTYPAAGYIFFANDGTRPHTPPWGPVAYWATRKGLNPGAVWWGIRKRGTRAQHFIEATVREYRPTAQALMEQAARRVLSRMGGR